MFKHKADDKVRIRSMAWIDAQATDMDGRIVPPAGYTYYFMPLMRNFCGMTAIVKSTGGNYGLDLDNGGFHWEDWMFDPDYDPAAPLSAEDAIRTMMSGKKLVDSQGREYSFMNNTFYLRHGDEVCQYFNLPNLYHRPGEK